MRMQEMDVKGHVCARCTFQCVRVCVHFYNAFIGMVVFISPFEFHIFITHGAVGAFM